MYHWKQQIAQQVEQDRQEVFRLVYKHLRLVLVASPIDINLDAPIMIEAGTYLHVILKIPVGTATASQIIRGTCFINGIF